MTNSIITSFQNSLVKHLIKLRQDKDYRYAQKSIVLEGFKVIQEVVTHIKRIFYIEPFPVEKFKGIDHWQVSEAVMKKISGVISPEGIIAEVQMPTFGKLNGKNYILALDGINDPGNLGTLLRTALALGWEGVYVLPNSCDPFNEKAIRAARGAHFKIPLAFGTALELEQLAKENRLNAFLADLIGKKPEALPSTGGRLLVLGNEAQGGSREVQQFCTPITIPMTGEMESLNVAVAGGILMYLLKS